MISYEHPIEGRQICFPTKCTTQKILQGGAIPCLNLVQAVLSGTSTGKKKKKHKRTGMKLDIN